MALVRSKTSQTTSLQTTCRAPSYLENMKSDALPYGPSRDSDVPHPTVGINQAEFVKMAQSGLSDIAHFYDIAKKAQMFTMCVLALPASDQTSFRAKRDVMESMKNAWNEIVRTFSEAGDAVVHVFKPTERSTVDKIADSFKNLAS